MKTLPPSLDQMADAARDYCSLIDSVEQGGNGLLNHVASLLSRLHVAVASLELERPVSVHEVSPDLDRRFELYYRLRRWLGARDSYWLEYDSCQSPQHMTGSLADDFTDIYFDLKYGLACIEHQRPDLAAQAWQSSYRQHWGQHLVDAERQLYALRTRNQLDS